MNQELLIEIQQHVNTLQESYDKILEVVNSLKIDSQLHVKKNETIKPGIATKVAYDANGLVLNGLDLEASDIPSLTIDQIDGLRKMLSDKANRTELKHITIDTETILKRGSIVGTGTKVNYDSHGLIVSTSDLLIEDVPQLPLSHIEGLLEELENIRTSIPESVESTNETKINPGTYPKITFDEYGHVKSGMKLGMDDIPSELLTRINVLEAKNATYATQKALDNVNQLLSKKVTKSSSVKEGWYQNVYVNSDGLVTDARKLSSDDIPSIQIEDIQSLRSELNAKADHSDLVQLNATVSLLVTSVNKIGDINSLKNQLNNVATVSALNSVQNELNALKETVEKLTSESMLEQEILSIKNDISTLNGRISVLENKL